MDPSISFLISRSEKASPFDWEISVDDDADHQILKVKSVLGTTRKISNSASTCQSTVN